MNFINDLKSDSLQVDLKYCERCGGLFLRPRACDHTFCAGCTAVLSARPQLLDVPTQELPGKRRPARLVKGPKLRRRDLQGRAQINYLQGATAAEVRA